LADLKPVQVKELKEAFEAMEKEGKGKGKFKGGEAHASSGKGGRSWRR
jgi:hypothetical protein